MNKDLHIVRILKGGSIIATESATEGTGRLAGVKRFRGQRYQIPSLRYLVKDRVSDETADLIDTYLESLSGGGIIGWAMPTADDVTVTQDREGNSLDTPRLLNRKYADIDFDALDSALDAFVNPAPKTTSSRKVKAGA